MDRIQATEALQQGLKIKHITFLDDEYLKISTETGRIITEDYFDMTDRFFNDIQFQKNWSIVQEHIF